MKHAFIICALGGSLLADTVTSGTGAFSGFSTNLMSSTDAWIGYASPPATPAGAFWNNPSADTGAAGSHMMNVGYLLSGTGGFAATPSVLGTDTVTDEFTGSGGGDPVAFNFLSTVTAYNIAILFADSSLNTGNAAQGTTFGYYVGSTFTPLYTPIDSNSPLPSTPFDPTISGGSYGFYATVCYAAGACETYTTGDGNFGNVSGAAGWNHFALFQLASGSYVIGLEDALGWGGEGDGDFNDVVVELKVDAVPEPGTIAIMGLGLAGLALLGSKRNALQRLFGRSVAL
jgi:hypothetical protein